MLVVYARDLLSTTEVPATGAFCAAEPLGAPAAAEPDDRGGVPFCAAVAAAAAAAEAAMYCVWKPLAVALALTLFGVAPVSIGISSRCHVSDFILFRASKRA